VLPYFLLEGHRHSRVYGSRRVTAITTLEGFTMAGLLDTALDRVAVEAEPLKEISRASHAGRVLAVCETPTGTMYLMRERTVGKKGPDGKRAREHGTEKVLKRTCDLADIAAAIKAGLL
jgi:hypothetical protein